MPIFDTIISDVTINFIEGLSRSQGKDVIMLVVDRLSKYTHFIAFSHSYSTKTVAQAYMDNVYKLHDILDFITSDRDLVFLSDFWQEFFQLQGVTLQLSTAYHP